MIRNILLPRCHIRRSLLTFMQHEVTKNEVSHQVFKRQLCGQQRSESLVSSSDILKHLFNNRNDYQKWEELEKMFNSAQLERAVQNLLDLGFSKKHAGKILLKEPSIINHTNKSLNNFISNLEALGFQSETGKTLIFQCPSLVNIPVQYLRKNFNELQSLMGNKDAKEAIKQSPDLIKMNQQNVKATFDYCIEAMGLSPLQVTKSNILSCDLKLVKLRHGLLEKAGYYKHPSLLKKDGNDKNPSFADMFFTDDEEFIKIFQGLTMEDYVIYEEITEAQGEVNPEDEDLEVEMEKARFNYSKYKRKA